MLTSLLGSIALTAAAFQTQAVERLQCGSHKDVVAQLAVKYSEQPVASRVSEIAGEAWQARLHSTAASDA